jgi:hypothetical protein
MVEARSQRTCNLCCTTQTLQLGITSRATPFVGRKVYQKADAMIEVTDSALTHENRLGHVCVCTHGRLQKRRGRHKRLETTSQTSYACFITKGDL